MSKMKLSNYINELNKILENSGELDCYYAKDDEGNNYQTVNYKPTVMYCPKDQEGRVVDLFDKEFLEGLNDAVDFKDYKKVICVN